MKELPDFDTLRWLAEHDPEQLERLQQEVSQDAIEQASEANRPQLTAMLHNFNLQMSRCTNPYARCILAIKLMNNKLLLLNQVVTEPENLQNKRASLLPFRRTKSL
ncbi:DUF3135 domain-containing protein [Shewanella sp. AS1]|uniref:DUF3135 domain-containing protein n=1 Tax=Shewanella sp. AS1 TaxID=2907626 RepID=UPI001F2B34BC|nr:DUF3135 domain-containing protein [Shewanella sp. AS1]MCE9678723.1 DUF3135 domain-containing protein [Shewanella sp. AS1]